MRQADTAASGPLLVLAPLGRDAAEIGRILGGVGVPTQAVASLADLCAALHADGGAGVAALLVAEEAIADGAGTLMACLGGQPPWSDLPVLVLTTGGWRRGPMGRWALFETLGNVTLLDRPMHAETLHSAARGALRARARQHETRAHLEALRQAAETLEARVEERTAELMAAEETLHQLQKMEAVGQLTGGIAHDFNNLLQGISGSLDLMRARIAEGRVGRLDRYITLAQDAASRAAALTHRLLAFARRQTLDPKPTQVSRLVAGMEELIRRSVGPGITVATLLADDLCPTLCDPNQLENALLNLCINARDAMPDGGHLVIEAANTWVGVQAARERDITPGGYVAISVGDTGGGMTPDVAEHAFEPFFTTKPLGQGTGLGLSMVYGFARQSGGQVRIYSTVGQGTTIRILLPQYQGEVREGEQKPEPTSAPKLEGSGTVLVVDDEPAIRTLITEMLVEMGYRTLEAGDGPSGLQILRSRAAIDLLITDVGLPGGMNGRQMVDAAREARPALKVLFITGYAESAALGDAGLAPGMHVLTKPFAMEALAAKVNAVVSVG